MAKFVLSFLVLCGKSFCDSLSRSYFRAYYKINVLFILKINFSCQTIVAIGSLDYRNIVSAEKYQESDDLAKDTDKDQDLSRVSN